MKPLSELCAGERSALKYYFHGFLVRWDAPPHRLGKVDLFTARIFWKNARRLAHQYMVDRAKRDADAKAARVADLNDAHFRGYI